MLDRMRSGTKPRPLPFFALVTRGVGQTRREAALTSVAGSRHAAIDLASSLFWAQTMSNVDRKSLKEMVERSIFKPKEIF